MADIVRIDFNSLLYGTDNPDGCNGRNYPFNNVAGENSKTNFRSKIVSDPVSDIVRLNFIDSRNSSRHIATIIPGDSLTENPYGDYLQDYDPNISKNSNIGFLEENENNRIYQIDNADGSVIASGHCKRWIPGQNESTAYVKVIGENNFKSYEDSGGVYIQEYASGSFVSWGSSIESITSLSNAHAINTSEAESSTLSQLCPNYPSTGYGSIPQTGTSLIPIKITKRTRNVNPNSDPNDACSQYIYSPEQQVTTGYIFTKVSGGGTILLYVILNSNISNLNFSSNIVYYIQSTDTTSIQSQTLPCFRYTISSANLLQDVKAVKFYENSNTGQGYEIGTAGNGQSEKVYQHDVKQFFDEGNVPKIDADLLSWIPSISTIYIRECSSVPFSILNGAITQYNTGARFGDKGIDINKSTFDNRLNNIRFVNLQKHIFSYEAETERDLSLVYSSNKQYVANWNNGGELLLQDLTKENSYQFGYDYTPGSKIIQIHKITNENNIEDYMYSFATVISWDHPDITNPADTSYMKLVAKIDKKGPRTPDSLLGVDDYNNLQLFKVGSLVDNTEMPVEFEGKIIPYTNSILNNLQANFDNWPYSFNTPGNIYFTTTKNGILIENQEEFSEKSEIPIPCSIGTTRIRCVSLNPNIDLSVEEYPLYKVYIFDTELFGSDSLFGSVTHISYRYKLEDNYSVSKKIIKIAEISGKESYFANNLQSKRTIIFEPNKDQMFIDINTPVLNSPIENVITNTNTLTFELQKIYSTKFAEGSDTLSIDVSSGSSPVSNESVFLLEEPEINWFVINRKTGKTFSLYPDIKDSLANDELIYLTEATPTYNSKKLVLKRNNSILQTTPNDEILVFAKVSTTINSNNIKTKQLSTQTETLITPLVKGTTGKYKNKYYIELMTGIDTNAPLKGIIDKLNSVYVVTGENEISQGTKNIKDLFEIEYGVNDQKITKPKLILKSGYVTSSGNLKSEYFSNSQNREVSANSLNFSISYNFYNITSTGPGIFVRESFKTGSNVNSIENIPFYLSTNTGNRYHYSSLIDFRPYDLFDNSSETLGDTKFVPHPDWSDSINTVFYLPRKDRVILTKDGIVEVLYGSPSVNSIFPEEPYNSMSLYLLNKPAYVFDNKNIQIIPINNKRYTMKEIGKIDKRVKKLEYYSSLSLLEANSESLLITDENGNNRFKTGILVDNFTGHNIGDTLHPDYNIAIDVKENYARPPFDINQSKLILDNSFDSYKFIESSKPGTTNIKTGIYTFPYKIVPFAVQPLASGSIGIQPNENINWSGNSFITPSSDTWIDQTKNPEILKNDDGINDGWKNINFTEINNNGPFSLHWKGWEIFSDIDNTETVDVQIKDINSKADLNKNNLNFSENKDIFDNEIIPYIRDQKIKIISSGLKPNSRIYTFFDGIDVSEYCYIYPTEEDLNNNTNKVKFTDSDSTKLKTTNDGKAYIQFEIPKSVFRTGNKIFEISDSSTNDKSRASTYSSEIFHCPGPNIPKNKSIITTREYQSKKFELPEITRNLLNINNNNFGILAPPTLINPSGGFNNLSFENQDVEIENGIGWCPSCQKPNSPIINPNYLAQTFIVNKNLHPEGIFIKSLDLFFAKKPNNPNLSVSVELRPTINNYPDNNHVYPGAISRKYASEIYVSLNPDPNNSLSKTRFEFDYPIYLEPGEHSIVIKGQSKDFEIYIAEIGENILNTEIKITNQPYVGVLMTSSNASAWTPEQNIDLMMIMNKCEFDTNIEYALSLKNNNINNYYTFDNIFVQSNIIDFNSCRTYWIGNLIPNNSVVPKQLNIIPNTTINLQAQYIYGTLISNQIIDAKFTIKAKTLNKDITPIIDIDKLGFITTTNKIEFNDGEENGELLPYANYDIGSSRARYISKIVTLEEGFESNNCKVILTLNKPKNTNIQVFAKLQSAYSTGDFHNENYIKLIPENELLFDSYSSSADEWKEFVFNLPKESDEPFNKFCIKICLYSSNLNIVPKIKDMRAVTVI